jgi:hypothetical protein
MRLLDDANWTMPNWSRVALRLPLRLAAARHSGRVAPTEAINRRDTDAHDHRHRRPRQHPRTRLADPDRHRRTRRLEPFHHRDGRQSGSRTEARHPDRAAGRKVDEFSSRRHRRSTSTAAGLARTPRLPGLFDGAHTFTLTPLPNGRTQLVQSESFSGVLVWISRGLLAKTAAGFEAMHAALNKRVSEHPLTPSGP